MVSGSFTSVLADLIVINRDARQRRDVLKGIDELAESIKHRGLIHPPVITRDYVLVAGERRVIACRSLGWTSIPIQWVDEVDPNELELIELEENIKRLDISWPDRVAAVKKWHDKKVEIDPNWTQDHTAGEIGVSRQLIQAQIDVANKVASGEIDPNEVKDFSTARNIIAREQERAKAHDAERLRDILSDEPMPKEESIIQEDFFKWAPVYDGPRFNFLHVDFPYGIGVDKFNQGAAPAHGGYDDTPATYNNLCSCLLDNLDRICADSAHLVFWFSMESYSQTLELLRTRFTILSHPLIWLKSDNSGILPDPSRGPRRIYETAFFGYRGDRKIVRAVSNAYAAPSVSSDHMSTKATSMLSYFFGMIVDQHTTMLDPTCGSGSALIAAERLGASRALGLEIDPIFVERARLRLKQDRNLRELSEFTKTRSS